MAPTEPGLARHRRPAPDHRPRRTAVMLIAGACALSAAGLTSWATGLLAWNHAGPSGGLIQPGATFGSGQLGTPGVASQPGGTAPGSTPSPRRSASLSQVLGPAPTGVARAAGQLGTQRATLTGSAPAPETSRSVSAQPGPTTQSATPSPSSPSVTVSAGSEPTSSAPTGTAPATTPAPSSPPASGASASTPSDSASPDPTTSAG